MTRETTRRIICGCILMLVAAAQLQGQEADSVRVKIDGVPLADAVRILAQFLDRPVLFIGASAATVTMDTPRPLARSDVLPLLRGIVEGHGFDLREDTVARMYRVRPRELPRPTEPPLQSRVPRASGSPELFVIPLKHAKAADVARTIASLYGRAAADASVEARPATLDDDLRRNLVNPVDGRSPGAPAPVPGAAGRTALPTGELVVVPDARANTLLLRVNRMDYELILQLVERIDVRPLQVLIEVLIAEVRRDRGLAIGVEGNLEAVEVGSGGVMVEGAMAGPGLGDFALRVLGIGGVDADVTLSLASQRGSVRILSRPVLMAANNELAEIVVGSQRPFVQVQRSLPTDGASRDQIVQYKAVGTKLTVTPSISDDGSVHLMVTQEVSSATTETAFDAPVISTRSVHTQLVVRDAQTVVLGGLTDRQQDVTRRGLPLLSAIPLIGGLFGSSQSRTTETELFVFLTPRVIRTDEDAMRLSTPLQTRVQQP